MVRGYTPERGQIDYAYAADDAKAAVAALTEYDRVATVELPYPVGRYETCRYSLVRVTPRSGRRHQIRRHFAHIRHPVVGDRTYGDNRHNQFFKEMFRLSRLMLMSVELSFCHPVSGKHLILQAPVPGKVVRLFDRVGWAGLA